MRVALLLRVPVVGDVDLAADDRLDARRPCAALKSSTAPAIEPWSVSETAGISSSAARADEVRDPAGPVEDRVLGVDVEVDEGRFGHGESIVLGVPADRGLAPRQRRA